MQDAGEFCETIKFHCTGIMETPDSNGIQVKPKNMLVVSDLDHFLFFITEK